MNTKKRCRKEKWKKDIFVFSSEREMEINKKRKTKTVVHFYGFPKIFWKWDILYRLCSQIIFYAHSSDPTPLPEFPPAFFHSLLSRDICLLLSVMLCFCCRADMILSHILSASFSLCWWLLDSVWLCYLVIASSKWAVSAENHGFVLESLLLHEFSWIMLPQIVGDACCRLCPGTVPGWRRYCLPWSDWLRISSSLCGLQLFLPICFYIPADQLASSVSSIFYGMPNLWGNFSLDILLQIGCANIQHIQQFIGYCPGYRAYRRRSPYSLLSSHFFSPYLHVLHLSRFFLP